MKPYYEEPDIKIYQGHILEVLKTFDDESVNTIITSPPYWGLRDYGENTKTIWDGDKNCEHQWIQAKQSGDIRYRPGHNTTVGNNKNPEIWDRPSRREYAGRTVKTICPVCKEEFEGKPQQKFCSTKCLNTLSNEERACLNSNSNFCQKCGAWYGQLGLEPTLDLYISHLLQVTAELKRVLRKDGIMFWNHSDAYCGSQGHFDAKNPQAREGKLIPHQRQYFAKCLFLQNFRLILKMIDEQGWILRNNIIWNKPNHMPSSVKDRFANGYEPVFMLVKNNDPVYFYNVKTGLMADRKPKILKEGIDWDWEEVGIVNENTFNVRVRDASKDRFIEGATEQEKKNYGKPKLKKVSYWHALDYWFDLDAVRLPHKAESLERVKGNWNGHREPMSSYAGMDIKKMCDPVGKNPGDLWTIPTQPFPEAHFATFPEKLVRPMILAGCPQSVCKKCGKARVRLTETDNPSRQFMEKDARTKASVGFSSRQPVKSLHRNISPSGKTKGVYYSGQTIGWTDCGCNAGWTPGIVLDPFVGAGAVLRVAKNLGYAAIGIDIKKDYCDMSIKGIKNITPNLPFQG